MGIVIFYYMGGTQHQCDKIECPLCGDLCNAYGLGRHLGKKHKSSHEQQRQVYSNVFHGGIEPLCACGCEKSVEFYGFNKGYAEFVKGHKRTTVAKRAKRAKEQAKVKFKCHVDDCLYHTSQAGRFGTHLKKAHKLDPMGEYVRLHSENNHPCCACGCGKLLPWKDWKRGFDTRFLKNHNARVNDPSVNPLRDPKNIKKAIAARSEGYNSGVYSVWNKGLTREIDERIANSADKSSATLKKQFISGDRVAWQKGHTKETHPSLAKASVTHKKRFKNGAEPWNKGLTKESSPKVQAIGRMISNQRLKDKELWCRFSHEQVLERIERFAPNFELLSSPHVYQNKYMRMKARCRECGETSSKSLMMLQNSPVCFFCAPKESKAQLEVFEFVRSVLPHDDVRLSDRLALGGKELDVFVPSRSFAIEHNGLYWHSDKVLGDQKYHTNKTKLCQRAGIKLLHVFEDEWRDRREIVKSMIRARLGCISERVYARKCRVIDLAPAARKVFFACNHLDGDVMSSESYGLMNESDELIAAISLGQPRKKIYSGMTEIKRFAVQKNLVVPGALGKLLAYAGARDFLTYIDLRYGTGTAYEHVGFKEVGQTGERFWWADTNAVLRYDRSRYMSDSKNNLTERQVADLAGVYRIYGCPNRIMVKEVS